MKFYTSASLSDAQKASEVVEKINQKLGDESIHDWWSIDPNLVDSDIARTQFHCVLAADYIVFLPPGGRGAHIELGIAIASELPIFVIGEIEKPIAFYTLSHFRMTTPQDYLEKIGVWKYPR